MDASPAPRRAQERAERWRQHRHDREDHGDIGLLLPGCFAGKQVLDDGVGLNRARPGADALDQPCRCKLVTRCGKQATAPAKNVDEKCDCEDRASAQSVRGTAAAELADAETEHEKRQRQAGDEHRRAERSR